MQKCPLCNTKYKDLVKVCPLKHCSNCGSLKLQSYKKRSFKNSRSKKNFVYLLPPLGFFILVYGYLFFQGSLVPFFSIVTVYTVFFIAMLFRATKENIDCFECNAKNFPYVSNINLNPLKVDSTIDDKDLSKKIAKTVLDGLSQEQRRHNRKDMVIRIIGAISLISIGILGTFFVNPDDVLLGEIIEIIKSFD